MELLRRLCSTPGVSGREERIRELIVKEMTPLVDKLEVDTLGNVIGFKRGTLRKKVMLSAHMDEIGFIVNYIEEEGFIRFLPVGGFDPRTLLAQRVVIHGREDVIGIIGSKPVHLLTEEDKKKPVRMEELFIDVGLPPERVKGLVRIGDPITLERELKEVGDTLNGKGLDDRIGVYVMLEALRRLKENKVDIYPVATVQEEVGVRGASVSTYGIEPDIGVAIDITIASDLPQIEKHQQITRLGKGVAIKVMDSYTISHPNLVAFLQRIAEEEKIPYQMEVLPRGGTDAAAIQRTKTGVPVATISIPLRYAHSSVEMAHRGDIENSVSLLTSFLERAHQAELK